MAKLQALALAEYTLSSGKRTVGCIAVSGASVAWDAAPRGTTVGEHEGGLSRHPLPVLSKKLADALVGLDAGDQGAIDRHIGELLLDVPADDQAFDAAIATSLACARLGAQIKSQPLYAYLAGYFGTEPAIPPLLLLNCATGSGHAGNRLKVTETILSIRAAPRHAFDLALAVGDRLQHYYQAHGIACATGLEASTAPEGIDDATLLTALDRIIAELGPDEIGIGFDLAGLVDAAALTALIGVPQRARIDYVEDPQGPVPGNCAMVAGDDLICGSLERLSNAAHHFGVNTAVAKLSHFGSISRYGAFVKAARARGFHIVASHRSQETGQDSIAQLAVALGTDALKAGFIARERIANYGMLTMIEMLRGRYELVSSHY